MSYFIVCCFCGDNIKVSSVLFLLAYAYFCFAVTSCILLLSPLWRRPYLVNLLPCLTRITKRQEETVQETLATAMPKIMSALGHFANDGEIKVFTCWLCAKVEKTNHRPVETFFFFLTSSNYFCFRCCWRHLWLIWSPAPRPLDGQQPVQLLVFASTPDAPATSTPGSLMCFWVGRTLAHCQAQTVDMSFLPFSILLSSFMLTYVS